MYRFTYNEDHFPVNIELPGGRTVAYEYDIQNRVVKTTDPEGRVTQTQWNGEFDEITRGGRWRGPPTVQGAAQDMTTMRTAT